MISILKIWFVFPETIPRTFILFFFWPQTLRSKALTFVLEYVVQRILQSLESDQAVET